MGDIRRPIASLDEQAIWTLCLHWTSTRIVSKNIGHSRRARSLYQLHTRTSSCKLAAARFVHLHPYVQTLQLLAVRLHRDSLDNAERVDQLLRPTRNLYCRRQFSIGRVCQRLSCIFSAEDAATVASAHSTPPSCTPTPPGIALGACRAPAACHLDARRPCRWIRRPCTCRLSSWPWRRIRQRP